MKIFILILILMMVLTSCDFDKTNGTVKNPDYHSLDEIVNACEGHAVVMATGFNDGNFKAYQYTLLIKDTKTNKTYEYNGGKYEVNIGDTLK